MTERPITRRGIYFIGGYDPKSAKAFFDRLTREISRFDETWGVASSLSAMRESPPDQIGTVEIDTKGDGWSTAAEFSFLVLDSLVLKDFRRPSATRLGKYLATLADYAATGTTLRMFASSWRFGLYHLFPLAALLLFAAAGLLAAWLVPAKMPLAPVLGIVVGLAVFALCFETVGRRWPVSHLMDLWSFSRNYLRGRRPDADALLDGWAAVVTARAAAAKFDEILLVGHSTGGALILDLAARCIARDPEFPNRAPHVTILTLGSTALKIGMHPAAGTFRSRVQALVDNGRIGWAEVQCMTDVINFHRVDPVVAMELAPRRSGGFPLIREVRIKHMLADATYKRIKRNFFRVHYQYVFGNTKRYFYDFFMVCCGPLSLAARMNGEVVGPGIGEESPS